MNNKQYLLFHKIGTNPIATFTASAKVQWNSKYYIPEICTWPTTKKESSAYKHDQIPSADTWGLLSSEIKQ